MQYLNIFCSVHFEIIIAHQYFASAEELQRIEMAQLFGAHSDFMNTILIVESAMNSVIRWKPFTFQEIIYGEWSKGELVF
jgi:hypothetical protein